MTRFLQLAMVVAGAALALGSVSACSDDSTASAPLTSNPVTTTSMYSTQPQASDSSEAPAQSPGSETVQSASGGSELPATAPSPATGTPQDVPGPNGQKVSAKGQAYLDALKTQKVTFMGDTDNSVALTMAEYVCNERRKGTDPVTVKAFVTASVGPGTKTVAEANAKADKVIKAADNNYC
ncbi:DUF732 domain-containing protein [Gordonia sp. CPCC 206044]|uniref:DUF732 domain-containing protein n=1 Tax=Gordonia sp. CPCC 206044 TaxID=3140793 RepID=UPI003AF3E72F